MVDAAVTATTTFSCLWCIQRSTLWCPIEVAGLLLRTVKISSQNLQFQSRFWVKSWVYNSNLVFELFWFALGNPSRIPKQPSDVLQNLFQQDLHYDHVTTKRYKKCLLIQCALYWRLDSSTTLFYRFRSDTTHNADITKHMHNFKLYRSRFSNFAIQRKHPINNG